MNLQQLIGSECDLVKSFIGILVDEQGALSSGDSERLGQITPQKTTLIARLNGIADARNRAMAKAGLPLDHEGLSAWASAEGDAGRELRDRLLALAAEARELNRLNGQLISLRLQSTQAGLDALGGGQSQRHTYGPDGQPRGPRTGYRFIDSV